jgi:15-cis-phytoene desaturase
MQRADVIVIGGGLAGLSCGMELSSCGRGVLLLEGRPVVGGRTSSWNERGMVVESGLHRVLGFYEAFPDLLCKAGLDVDRIVYWEDEAEIRLPDGRGPCCACRRCPQSPSRWSSTARRCRSTA